MREGDPREEAYNLEKRRKAVTDLALINNKLIEGPLLGTLGQDALADLFKQFTPEEIGGLRSVARNELANMLDYSFDNARGGADPEEIKRKFNEISKHLSRHIKK